jgi:hypothetical protein
VRELRLGLRTRRLYRRASMNPFFVGIIIGAVFMGILAIIVIELRKGKP